MEWIDVKDRLPEVGIKVIGYFPVKNESGLEVDTAINRGDKFLVSDYPNSTAHYFIATHWQPLPEPPKI